MNKWFKNIAFGVAIVSSLTACQKLEEVNIDPNRAEEVNTDLLLVSSQKEFMDDIWDQWMNGRFGMLYAQYWAQNAYTNESRYQIRVGTNNTYWTTYYAGDNTTGGGLINLQEIIRICDEKPELVEKFGGNPNNQKQIARIMKVWMFQILTDVYGDIPYSEALKGNKMVFPKYDKQRDIYINMLKELTEASAALDATKSSYRQDAIYSGNVQQWKKFANSLKLRVAMRMADKEDALAKTAVEQAVAAGVFTGNADNALLRYVSAPPSNNPLNEDRKTRADFAVSNILIDTLIGLNDPRLGMYADQKVNGGGFVGKVYGLSDAGAAAQPNGEVSQPSLKVLAADAPGVFMDYAEVEFLLAEAVERGYNVGGTAESHYNAGIAASMNYWGITNSTAIAAYTAQPNVAYTSPLSGADWRHKIGVQKWLALYMQGIQGWTEWRRLDFGVLKMPAAGIRAAARSTVIPTRYLYPSDEATLNTAAYTAAVASQGADRQDTKLWWDR